MLDSSIVNNLNHYRTAIFGIANIPGMEWILSYQNGALKLLINSYLPVVMLLSLILILPLLFEWIAIYYEKRKTKSDVQRSIVGRYFYYQVCLQ